MAEHWTLWGASREVSSERPLPVTVDERHLVLWRTSEGGLSLLDGACRHLGASLGHVGRVVDGCVRCPFHGWTYDRDGANVEQPGLTRTGRARTTSALRSYGATEEAGLVLLSPGARSERAHADQEVRADLADALGVHESMGGATVTGRAQRWVLRHGDGASPDERELVHWLLSGRDGDRSVPGTDPAWSVLPASVRVERSRGPISALNGLHSTVPGVRFLRSTTDPVVETRTVGGGIHVARRQPGPETLRPTPGRRRDHLANTALRGSRLVVSLSALTSTSLAVTAVAVYPDQRGRGPATAFAADLLLRTWFGTRLTRLALALDTARIAGTGPGDQIPRRTQERSCAR